MNRAVMISALVEQDEHLQGEQVVAIEDLIAGSGIGFGTSGVRGRVLDMTHERIFAYTTAFLDVIAARSGRVAVAMDLRPSSPDIAAACAAAIRYAGLDVEFCGAIPTPALAYYANRQRLPAVMVTGSHIPFDRNGIKFYGFAGEITKTDEASISEAVVCMPKHSVLIPLPEINPSAYQQYLDRYLQFFPARCLEGMRIGFYEHSSVARDLLRGLLERLGADVIGLGRTDRFVPIDTEAVSDLDIQRARHWADQHGFDAIVSTDGDADRPLLGDELGNWFRGDVVGILCAQYLEARGVVTTISCNTAVERCGSFEHVLRTRIGSPHVIEGLARLARAGVQNLVGFEPNGGFLLGSRIEKNGRTMTPLLTRDAVLPILCLLSMAREKACRVSALPLSLPARFTASDRLQNFPPEVSRLALLKIVASSGVRDEFLAGLGGRVVSDDQTDGLRLFFENDEIVHFRPSGNAPELRCYAESASQARSESLVREGLGRMSELAPRY